MMRVNLETKITRNVNQRGRHEHKIISCEFTNSETKKLGFSYERWKIVDNRQKGNTDIFQKGI